MKKQPAISNPIEQEIHLLKPGRVRERFIECRPSPETSRSLPPGRQRAAFRYRPTAPACAARKAIARWVLQTDGRTRCSRYSSAPTPGVRPERERLLPRRSPNIRGGRFREAEDHKSVRHTAQRFDDLLSAQPVRIGLDHCPQLDASSAFTSAALWRILSRSIRTVTCELLDTAALNPRQPLPSSWRAGQGNHPRQTLHECELARRKSVGSFLIRFAVSMRLSASLSCVSSKRGGTIYGGFDL